MPRPVLPRPALAAVLAVSLAPPMGAAAAATPEGLWATPEANGRVEIRSCGLGVCGVAVSGDRAPDNPRGLDVNNRDPALRSRALTGLQLFEELKGGPRTWRGKVYNPVDGGTYSGSVTLLSADRLKLEGCIVWPLCKSQVWRRVN